MKQTRLLMGMPITLEIIDNQHSQPTPSFPPMEENKKLQFSQDDIFQEVFDYFTYVDNTFSTYKETSEISQMNSGKLSKKSFSEDMQEVLFLSEQTKHDTNGYFDIQKNGKLDPSGLVKGWAIYNAYKLLKNWGFENFYIDAGGNIQFSGKKNGRKWTVGIKNPFNEKEIIKVLAIEDKGVATSGTYIRGQHVYDPFAPDKTLTEIVSITVIGPNVYEADRYATAAFAMQKKGIEFIQSLKGFEGYMIDKEGIATYTTGFEKYVLV